MNPNALFLDHRGPLRNGLQSQSVRALLKHQLGSLPQVKTLPNRLGQNDPARLVNFDCHTIYDGICHLQWQEVRSLRAYQKGSESRPRVLARVSIYGLAGRHSTFIQSLGVVSKREDL